MDIGHLHLHARDRALKPLYEDDTFVSFRCADPDAYAIEVYWDGS